jgi:hypothetical protein
MFLNAHINNFWLGMIRLLALVAIVGFAQSASPGTIDYVVHISVDGLSALYLQQALTSSPAVYPNFDRLIREAAFSMNCRCDYHQSDTLPNHTCMVTARPVLQPEGMSRLTQHGFYQNSMVPGWTLHNQGNLNLGYVPGVFDVVHDHGLSTALYSSKSKFTIFTDSYNLTNGAPDLIGEDNGRNKIDTSMIIDTWYAAPLVSSLLNQLTNNPPRYTFLHMSELDYSGHTYAWGSSNWFADLAVVDANVGKILDTINGSVTLSNQTAVILVADHGGEPNFTHVYPERPFNYTIPLFVWAPGIVGGTDLYTLFANRYDPGTNRVNYSAPFQPLRNGDSGNLALDLLELPPVPGSLMIPLWGKPAPRLFLFRATNSCEVFHPPTTNLVLETIESLYSTNNWQTVETMMIQGDTNAFSASMPLQTNNTRFFRLRVN